MKINKQAIKDAVDVLKLYQTDTEKQLRLMEAILPESDNPLKSDVKNLLEERLRKTKTSIAQLSIVLYSK